MCIKRHLDNRTPDAAEQQLKKILADELENLEKRGILSPPSDHGAPREFSYTQLRDWVSDRMEVLLKMKSLLDSIDECDCGSNGQCYLVPLRQDTHQLPGLGDVSGLDMGKLLKAGSKAVKKSD